MFPKVLLVSLLASALAVNALTFAREPKSSSWKSDAVSSVISSACEDGESCEPDLDQLAMMRRRGVSPGMMITFVNGVPHLVPSLNLGLPHSQKSKPKSRELREFSDYPSYYRIAV